MISSNLFQIAATTMSSDKHSTSLVYNISNDTNISCIFHLDKQKVEKRFNLVAKGCMPPKIRNSTFKPINEMGKISPGTVITIKCNNSTKFNLSGEKYVNCTDQQDGSNPFYKFNSTLPQCVFLGIHSNLCISFSNIFITSSFYLFILPFSLMSSLPVVFIISITLPLFLLLAYPLFLLLVAMKYDKAKTTFDYTRVFYKGSASLLSYLTES